MLLVSWNVLADEYIRPSYYPHTPLERLDPAWRRPRVIEHARALGADLLCLQEVDETTCAALTAALPGYRSQLLCKTDRTEGVALFIGPGLEMVATRELVYQDGVPATGCGALIARLRAPELGELTVATTHLKWEPPSVPPKRRIGLRQIDELIDALARGPAARVICGDLNSEPRSPVLERLAAAGYRDLHGGASGPFTANPNGRAKRIDHVLPTDALDGEPLPLFAIDDVTPLPSQEHPSDHLAVGVRLRAS